MAYKPKLSAKEIERLLHKPVSVQRAMPPGPAGIMEGQITCPACNEPIPIRVLIRNVAIEVQFPRKKQLLGG